MNSWRLSSVMWPAAVRNSIAGVPFVLGEADFAEEVVQVPGQGLHELLQARVLGLVEGRDDGVHEFLFDGGLLRADGVSGVGGVGHAVLL